MRAKPVKFAETAFLGILILAGCQKPPEPPKPSYVAIRQKLAALESSVETHASLETISQKMADVSTEAKMTKLPEGIHNEVLLIGMTVQTMIEREAMVIRMGEKKGYDLRHPPFTPSEYDKKVVALLDDLLVSDLKSVREMAGKVRLELEEESKPRASKDSH